jgi:hypothetical protein
MPYELRVMLFDASEVLDAVTHYRRQSGAPVPDGDVLTFKPETSRSSGDVAFRIMVAPSKPGEDLSWVPPVPCITKAPALAASLILYCKRRRIPLPAAATKSLQVILGHVGFVLTTPGGEGMPSGTPQLGD